MPSVGSRELGVPAAGIDDEQAGRLVSERLGVVRQRPIQQHVVARPGFHDGIALRDADAPLEDDVMLVAGVRVEAGALPGLHHALEDGDVAGHAAVDLRHRSLARSRAWPT